MTELTLTKLTVQNKKLTSRQTKKKKKRKLPFGCTACGFAAFSQTAYLNHVRLMHFSVLKSSSLKDQIKESLSFDESSCNKVKKMLDEIEDMTPNGIMIERSKETSGFETNTGWCYTLDEY